MFYAAESSLLELLPPRGYNAISNTATANVCHLTLLYPEYILVWQICETFEN